MYYLLEIGTEELPAGATTELLNNFANLFENKLQEYNINNYNINKYTTPRRLALLLSELPAESPAREELIQGPGTKAPEQAIEGFAKKYNLKKEQLILENNRYCAKQTINSIDIKDILADCAKHAIHNLKGEKWMTWGVGDYSFTRPIRWIVSLLDNNILEFEIYGLTASNKTRVNRLLEAKSSTNNHQEFININSAQDYLESLRKKQIEPERDTRKNIVLDEFKKLEANNNFSIQVKNSLLEEVIDLIEYPKVLLAEFDQKYLAMPDFVNITVMNDHQRYFACYENNTNTLSSKFVIVANCLETATETVIEGNKKVLHARLADGEFFVTEALNTPLDSYYNKLANMTFQKELKNNHTMQDKVNRLKLVAKKLASSLNLNSQETEDLINISYLAKQDLASNLVFEFTELQGLVGGYIASKQEYNTNISQGISEQYLPQGQDDKLPQSKLGSIFSIIDKIDNITVLFYLGKIPTGSADPFALRRQAQGIIQILLSNTLNTNINIFEIIKIAFEVLTEQSQDNKLNYSEFINTVHKKKLSLIEFIKQRILHILSQDNNNHSKELLECFVTDNNIQKYSIQEILNNINNYQEAETQDNKITESLNRITRILNKQETLSTEIKEDLLKEPAEQELYQSISSSTPDYQDICTKIEIFFDNILVQDKENSKQTNNRLNLLSQIKSLFDKQLGSPDWLLLNQYIK